MIMRIFNLRELYFYDINYPGVKLSGRLALNDNLTTGMFKSLNILVTKPIGADNKAGTDLYISRSGRNARRGYKDYESFSP